MLEYDLIYLVAAGLILGIFSALFGVGGGILIVPLLQALYPKMLPQEWIGTSFAVILLTSSLNSYLFARRKFDFHKEVIMPLCVGLCAGTLTGQQLSFFIPTHVFFLIFGLTLFSLGTKRLFFPKKVKRKPLHFAWPIHFVVGILVGLLSGLVGIGGGSLIIPYLLLATSIPVKLLSFHSNVMMIFGSFFGVINFMLKPKFVTGESPLEFMTVGLVHWGMALCFWAGILVTAKLGVLLGQRLSEEKINKFFALILFALGTRFLFKVVMAG